MTTDADRHNSSHAYSRGEPPPAARAQRASAVPPSRATSPLSSALDSCGIVAILRGAFLPRIEAIVEALAAGGVRAIEISLTSPDALTQIARAAAVAGEGVAIGAGTVMTCDEVRAVRAEGASFVVAPIVDADVIACARGEGLETLPGAYTPTEAVTADRLGATGVKLFPADALGPAFVRGLLAPLPALRLVPTGGVTLALAREFASAGAWAVGVGSPLLSSFATDGDRDALHARARAFVAAMRPSAEGGA